MSAAAAVVSMQTSLRTSQATIDAQKKRHEQCVDQMSIFQSKGSTLEQKRFYASCVQEVFPAPSNVDFDWVEPILTAAIFILLFLCGVIWNETFGRK